ncbi:hypothetical protein ACTFIW_009731 [Dictyostelium discoideum]
MGIEIFFFSDELNNEFQVELDLSHSRFSNYSNLNNLLISIQHCQSFNIIEISINNVGFIQPQPQPPLLPPSLPPSQQQQYFNENCDGGGGGCSGSSIINGISIT